MHSNLKEVLLPTAKVYSYNTRSLASKYFFIKTSGPEIKRKLFSRVGARLWNELPTKLRMQPKIKFKKKLDGSSSTFSNWMTWITLMLKPWYDNLKTSIHSRMLLSNHYILFTSALYLTLLTAVDKMNISLSFYCNSAIDQFRVPGCRWLRWLWTRFCSAGLDLMFTSSRGSCCGGGSVVIVVGGGWECETGLLLLFSSILFSKVTLARLD